MVSAITITSSEGVLTTVPDETASTGADFETALLQAFPVAEMAKDTADALKSGDRGRPLTDVISELAKKDKASKKR